MLLFIITIIHFNKLLSHCSAFQQIFDLGVQGHKNGAGGFKILHKLQPLHLRSRGPKKSFDWVSRDTNRELEGSKFFTSSNLYISVLGGPRKALISPAKKNGSRVHRESRKGTVERFPQAPILNFAEESFLAAA